MDTGYFPGANTCQKANAMKLKTNGKKVLMCWYSIPTRTSPLNGTKFSADSGDILDVSSDCHFFETLDWSENQQVAAQEPQLICYDTENGCESSSSSFLHQGNAEVTQFQLFASLASSAPSSSIAYDLLDLQDLETTSTHDYPQAITLDEFSLLLSSSFSGAANASKNANPSACSKVSHSFSLFLRFSRCSNILRSILMNTERNHSKNATTIKTTKRVEPDRSQETSEFANCECANSRISNQEKKKDVHESFEELLSLQGFSVPRRSNPTLNEIRRAEEVERLSPTSIKIQNWLNGKEGNIRALLASLNDVLWEGAGQWPHHRMAELLSRNQVKKCYHRSCLLVHPDKHVGQEHEELARAIFTELNEAWNVFAQSIHYSS
ncbi:unnamed protein product [Cylicocyclus nassatus]|uniref:Uncharacterized protein n=1 Tax=Cylicocyclus nassatus TaxID=53992 RepID=A0AA36H7Y5_CYLNA|nr:unnamed protein product [Cylicocyclus nassatus]